MLMLTTFCNHCREKISLSSVIEGYLWRTLKPLGVAHFVRGIRTWQMDGAEERLLQIQNTWGPILYGPLWWPIPTLYLESPPELRHVSSTLVRTLLATVVRGGDSAVVAATDSSSNTHSRVQNHRGIGTKQEENHDPIGGRNEDGLQSLIPLGVVDEVRRLYSS